MDLKEFCKRLPKIELHAHLNGSLSKDTLLKLGCYNESVDKYSSLKNYLEKTEQTLNNCFDLFKVAHDLTGDLSNLYTATRDVIKEFYDDGVIYLELRTTPKGENGMSRKNYIRTVIRAIQDDQSTIIVKLILSIDRKHEEDEAEKILDSIIEMKAEYPNVLVGVDLCGNPNIGKFDQKLFERARQNGLYVTLHCGEIMNHKETMDILQFQPDRIGHGTCIHPESKGSIELWNHYINHPIPIEACMSSNVICGTCKDYESHHIKFWYNNELPFSLGTDDKGVFSTTLSSEYYHFAKIFDCKEEYLLNLCKNTVQQTFATEEEKKRLMDVFGKFMGKIDEN